MILAIHPVVQFSATLLALYVLYLGFQRFRILHLKQKAHFPWKRHVLLGKIVIGTWLIGLINGITMVYIYWHTPFATGIHAKIALIILPVALFVMFSGLYLDRVRQKRRLLPVIHGITNLALLILALIQVFTGWQVFESYVLGL